jgi:hypothetical protein
MMKKYSYMQEKQIGENRLFFLSWEPITLKNQPFCCHQYSGLSIAKAEPSFHHTGSSVLGQQFAEK